MVKLRRKYFKVTLTDSLITGPKLKKDLKNKINLSKQNRNVSVDIAKAIYNRLAHIMPLLVDPSSNFYYQLEVPMIKCINHGFIKNCQFRLEFGSTKQE